MKTHIATILFLITINLFGQNLDKCGIDNNPILTPYESDFLNKYMSKNQIKNFDFSEKKIVFITNTSGQNFGTKSEYFNAIKEWDKNGNKISTGLIVLNEKEKIDSGGYDAIVTYWVKKFTTRRKRKIVKKLQRQQTKIKIKN